MWVPQVRSQKCLVQGEHAFGAQSILEVINIPPPKKNQKEGHSSFTLKKNHFYDAYFIIYIILNMLFISIIHFSSIFISITVNI